MLFRSCCGCLTSLGDAKESVRVGVRLDLRFRCLLLVGTITLAGELVDAKWIVNVVRIGAYWVTVWRWCQVVVMVVVVVVVLVLVLLLLLLLLLLLNTTVSTGGGTRRVTWRMAWGVTWRWVTRTGWAGSWPGQYRIAEAERERRWQTGGRSRSYSGGWGCVSSRRWRCRWRRQRTRWRKAGARKWNREIIRYSIDLLSFGTCTAQKGLPVAVKNALKQCMYSPSLVKKVLLAWPENEA